MLMCTNEVGPIRLVARDGWPDIVVGRALVVIGRHPDCDVRLDLLRISRHHCCMIAIDGAVMVTDLGSTNGVRINGSRVRSGWLKPGDTLSIAHLDYRVEGALVYHGPSGPSVIPAGRSLREGD